MKTFLKKFRMMPNLVQPRDWESASLILAAQTLMHADNWKAKPNFSNPFWIQEKEFRVYSQFGDDGIIQWLLYILGINRGKFIEFGVGDFYESNTHFLLINNRFSGFIMDGSEENISIVRRSPIYWRYNLDACQCFIDRDNVQDLLAKSRFEKIELLHIDLDGNDYWILDSISLNALNPDILILEYNAIFGVERKITVPYVPNFSRMNAHYSCKYFGASLSALVSLANSKGYYFIGCNSAGNNAYFLANRFLSRIPATNVGDGFQEAGFRESRDKQGTLTYFDADQQFDQIRGMPVVDVENDRLVEL